jgi:DNA repair protein RecN (Recombination protein N)
MKTNETLFLKSLNLQNFATFENQTVNFSSKFNAIVGETGSGKSLILDALQIIFGARADKKLIRKNAEFSTIEAIFYSNDPKIKSYFNEIGHPYEGNEIVVKRIIYSNESSKSYLNFQSCSANLLTGFAKRFVDLVGQFENQKLLSEDYQLVLLDSFSGLKNDIKDYSVMFTQLTAHRKDLTELTNEKNIRAQREDYIRFQLEELDKLSPSAEEENELLQKKEIILNFEKRNQTLGSIASAISEDEINLLGVLKICLQKAEKNPNVVSEDIITKLYDVKSILEDISFDVSKSLETNVEENIEEILDRLDNYSKLKRKFGGTTESMIHTYLEFKNELNSYGHLDEKITIVTKKIAELESKSLAFAEELHAVRSTKAKLLSQELTEKVRELKMTGASLKLNVSRHDHLTAKGLSKVEFIAETNPGEGFFKVKEIASGGELSRILLAVRQILSSNDTISVFLFDEIDTGIGGETAVTIGRSLQSVSGFSQVLAITHLPQIALFADQLINVTKITTTVDDVQRTLSVVAEASGDGKNEILKAMNPLL